MIFLLSVSTQFALQYFLAFQFLPQYCFFFCLIKFRAIHNSNLWGIVLFTIFFPFSFFDTKKEAH